MKSLLPSPAALFRALAQLGARDIAEIAGGASIVVAAMLFNLPLGFLVLGVLLLAFAYLTSEPADV